MIQPFGGVVAMDRRRIVRVLVWIEVALTLVVVALSVRHGSQALLLAVALMMLLLGAVGLSAWYFAGRMLPVDEAFELGYRAGMRDGRRVETLSVVTPLRRVSG